MTRTDRDIELARRVTETLPWLKAAREARTMGEVREHLDHANRLLEECAGRLTLRQGEKA